MSALPARTRYYPRQILTSDDFRADQSWHLASARRHALAAHGPGVVDGLFVAREADHWIVRPGLAIDGFGRELLVGEAIRFDQRLEDAVAVSPRAGRYRVLLQYQQESYDGRYWDETPVLVIEPASEPVERPDFKAWQPAPDNPNVRWPVQLAILETDAEAAAGYRIVVDDSCRDTTSVVASALLDPSGGAWLTIGDRIEIRPPAPVDASETPVGLSLDSSGTMWLADASIDGALTVEQELHFTKSRATVPAEPWCLYRHSGESTSSAAADVTTLRDRTGGKVEPAERPDEDELRIVLPQGHGRLVIGHADEAFTPVLEIDPDGQVIVHGDLVVEGQVSTEMDGTVLAQNRTLPEMRGSAMPQQEKSTDSSLVAKSIAKFVAEFIDKFLFRARNWLLVIVGIAAIFGVEIAKPIEWLGGCSLLQVLEESMGMEGRDCPDTGFRTDPPAPNDTPPEETNDTPPEETNDTPPEETNDTPPVDGSRTPL